jgi:hypothetical protein
LQQFQPPSSQECPTQICTQETLTAPTVSDPSGPQSYKDWRISRLLEEEEPSEAPFDLAELRVSNFDASHFLRVQDAVNFSSQEGEPRRINIFSGKYPDEVKVAVKAVELFSSGMVYLQKVSISQNCTLRHLSLTYLEAHNAPNIAVHDCMITEIRATTQIKVTKSKLQILTLSAAHNSHIQKTEIDRQLTI